MGTGQRKGLGSPPARGSRDLVLGEPAFKSQRVDGTWCPYNRVQLPVVFVQCGGSQRMQGLVRCWAQPGMVPGLGSSERPSILAQRA